VADPRKSNKTERFQKVPAFYRAVSTTYDDASVGRSILELEGFFGIWSFGAGSFPRFPTSTLSALDSRPNIVSNLLERFDLMKKHILLVAACILWIAIPAQAAFDAFLKLEGVPGEATATGHKDEIEIESFSMGVARPGGSAGSAQLSDISFVHVLDKASPLLILRCAQGTHIPTAVLTCRTASGASPFVFYRITLTDVIVTSVSVGGASGSDRPTESFSLNYATIEWEYIPQLPTGGAGTPVRATWNVARGTP
jgi:type VI secretion system secreted protein Hcp